MIKYMVNTNMIKYIMIKSKDNQTMRFGQLTEYNLRIIFLKKSYTKCQNVSEKLFPDPFLKSQNWAYLWINCLKFYAICFYCIPSLGLSKSIEIKLQTFRFYLQKAFLKSKKVWSQSPCLILYMIFKEKYLSCYILLPAQIQLPGCLLW